MDPETYLIEIKAKLAVSSFILSIDIIDERTVLSDRFSTSDMTYFFNQWGDSIRRKRGVCWMVEHGMICLGL